jgi:hypothetical protein
VAVAAQDREVRAALRRRLSHFVTSDLHASDVTFEIVTVGKANEHDLPQPPTSARSVYASALGDVLYVDPADQLFMNVGADLRVVAEAGLGRVRASVRGPTEPYLWLVTHPLFPLPLMECLKRRSLYSVHAAGLAIDGRGLLVAGTSGAGKSTLAVALLRVGLEFMGDDMLFLAPTDDGLQLHAFPDEIDITEQTANLFSELTGSSTVRERPAGRSGRSPLMSWARPGSAAPAGQRCWSFRGWVRQATARSCRWQPVRRSWSLRRMCC